MTGRRAIDRADVVAAAIAIAESNGSSPLTEQEWGRLRGEGFGWWILSAEKTAEAAVRSYVDRRAAVEDEKECPTCGAYLRGCQDCGAEYADEGGCGSCLGLLPQRPAEGG